MCVILKLFLINSLSRTILNTADVWKKKKKFIQAGAVI